MTHYDRACPGIAGRLLTAHEAAEADAMRAALVASLVEKAGAYADDARWNAARRRPNTRSRVRAAWATVLALLLAPEAT